MYLPLGVLLGLSAAGVSSKFSVVLIAPNTWSLELNFKCLKQSRASIHSTLFHPSGYLPTKEWFWEANSSRRKKVLRSLNPRCWPRRIFHFNISECKFSSWDSGISLKPRSAIYLPTPFGKQKTKNKKNFFLCQSQDRFYFTHTHTPPKLFSVYFTEKIKIIL